jgi:hypothetical protein
LISVESADTAPFFPDGESNDEIRITVEPGAPVNLDCGTNAHPKPEVIWYFSESATGLTNAKDESTEVFEIPEMDSTKKGYYTCIVKNPFGDISRTFIVEESKDNELKPKT